MREGDKGEEGGDAVELQKSGTGSRNKSSVKLKHTLVYLISQSIVLSALHLDRMTQSVNMRVACIFLHKLSTCEPVLFCVQYLIYGSFEMRLLP